MSKEAISQYLTEAMGECWHEWYDVSSWEIKYPCVKCGERWFVRPLEEQGAPNFFTNEGYGKLRDFYDGWDDEKRTKFLVFLTGTIVNVGWESIGTIVEAFHRDNLAPLMAEFLQGEG